MKTTVWIAAAALTAAAMPMAFAQHEDNKPASGIKEVTLERTPCFGGCPVYKVTLRSDGTATYVGSRFVDRIGTYEGKFWARDFERLAKVIENAEFWTMKDKYTLPITDQASQILTVKSDKSTKTVSEYGDSGPEDLWALQLVVDGVVARVQSWEKVDPE